jgi:hypothetical protein
MIGGLLVSKQMDSANDTYAHSHTKRLAEV